MRLRQVAIACHDVNDVVGALSEAFGLRVAYRDPGIIHYGLENAVLPAGGGFLEVLAPVRPDASAARFLARRGGDAGYMLIFQVADAEAERARVAALAVRVVDDIDRPGYRASHYHPNDFGGVLGSIDQQRTVTDHLEPLGDWWPAGPDWRAALAPEGTDLAGATLGSADPDALASRWAELLGRPLTGPRRLTLDRGELRFAASEAPGTTIAEIELKVVDPAAALDRARHAGLPMTEGGVRIGGVTFIPRD